MIKAALLRIFNKVIMLLVMTGSMIKSQRYREGYQITTVVPGDALS